jgi:hypothetical protein
MGKYYVDITKIYDDVCNWEQSKDDLIAWTPETIRAELETIDFPEDENGYTIGELAIMYYDAVKKLASELD